MTAAGLCRVHVCLFACLPACWLAEWSITPAACCCLLLVPIAPRLLCDAVAVPHGWRCRLCRHVYLPAEPLIAPAGPACRLCALQALCRAAGEVVEATLKAVNKDPEDEPPLDVVAGLYSDKTAGGQFGWEW